MKKIFFMVPVLACMTSCQENKSEEVELVDVPVLNVFEKSNFPRQAVDVKEFSQGFQHIGIPSADIQGSIDFYTTLGFTLATRHDVEGRDFAFMQLGNLLIELIPTECPALLNGAVDHFCLDVKNIDQLYAKMKEAGYYLLDDHVNEISFWENGAKYFFIIGPNQEKIEFSEVL